MNRPEIVCPDCGVKEGELHVPGCDMEQCPFCHQQLFSCDCELEYNKMEIRIPFLHIPIFCALCGKEWTLNDCFMDDDWEKYVPPLIYSNAQINLQDTVICPTCYARLKELFPNGWKEIEENK